MEKCSLAPRVYICVAVHVLYERVVFVLYVYLRVFVYHVFAQVIDLCSIYSAVK